MVYHLCDARVVDIIPVPGSLPVISLSRACLPLDVVKDCKLIL